jgi:dGTPase
VNTTPTGFCTRLRSGGSLAPLLEVLAEDDAEYGGTPSVDGRLPNAAATEAAALAHDLGHPPFGHIAELALDDRCKEIGGFESNAQAFRIVTKLATGYDTPGLNLTRVTRNGVLKYPWLRAGDERKFGAYESEQAVFEETRRGLPDRKRTLEATLMDWVDDIAYALHDLEDFYRAGMIPLDRLISDQVEQRDFTNRIMDEFKRTGTEYDLAELNRAQSFLFDDALLSFTGPFDATNQHRHALHRFATVQITRFLGGVTIGPTGIVFAPATRHEVLVLKQMTWQYVMHNPALTSVQQGQVKVIEDLYDLLLRWSTKEFAAKTLYRLPNRLRGAIEAVEADPGAHASLPDVDQRCARGVCDYVASLSEDQALELHGRLCGLSQASILDSWVRA